jgi:hypothetical protein
MSLGAVGRSGTRKRPDSLSVEDFYLRYNFSKGFIAPHGMTHQQLVAALSRGFADIEAHERRSFDFEVAAGRFEVLDPRADVNPLFFYYACSAASIAERQRRRSRSISGGITSRHEMPTDFSTRRRFEELSAVGASNEREIDEFKDSQHRRRSNLCSEDRSPGMRGRIRRTRHSHGTLPATCGQ